MRHAEKPENKKRYDQMVKLYKLGLSAREIGEKVGCTASGVMYVLVNRKVKRKPNGYYAKPTPDYSLRIRAYAHSILPILGTGPGTSAAALARKGGFLPGTLLNHLRAMGVSARHGMGEGNVKLNVDQVRLIKGLILKRTKSFAQIGEKYGVAHGTIWAIANGKSWGDIPWPGGKPFIPDPSTQRKRTRVVKGKGKTRTR